MEAGSEEASTIMTTGIDIGSYFLDLNEFKLGLSAPFLYQTTPIFRDLHEFKREFTSPFLHQSTPSVHTDLSPDPDFDPSSFLEIDPKGNSPEDCEVFSDIALKYIREMLLEEDLDSPVPFNEESCLALRATERPFYEILGEKYPPSPDQHPLHDLESPDDFPGDGVCSISRYGSSSSSSNADGSPIRDASDCSSSQDVLKASRNFCCHQSFDSPSNSSGKVLDGWDESPTSRVVVNGNVNNSHPIWQFQKGLEEASKLLPDGNSLYLNLENISLMPGRSEEIPNGGQKVEKKDRNGLVENESRGRKKLHPDDLELEGGRSNKQTAVFPEETVKSDEFDMVLLCGGDKSRSALSTFQEALQNGVIKNSQSEQPKGSNRGGKSRWKKQGRRDVVDLETLLSQCAQAAAANDRRTGGELLKQIRQHSSPFGNGSQRLAHYFANGLEARLAGTGSETYMELMRRRTTVGDVLKAYHLYLAACPFKRVTYFFANQTILDTLGDAPRLHIVDFGICYGFQWPCFLQKLSKRHCGPPIVRITGIDLPEPGFRPANRVEETGRRLTDYARRFNVPFEYVPIACSNWETIQVEDLKIRSDEVTVVNACYQFSKLADETVTVHSPRNAVLKLIKEMNPDVFIHASCNGAYGAPFFISRFREALYHWSAMFDMLETNVPREQPERLLIEREFFGREALNVIACEGKERIDRPETYKQWRVRMTRAGLLQLPLNQDIMKKSLDRVRSSYHKDYIIDEDSQFLLLGWKGRILLSVSAWKSK